MIDSAKSKDWLDDLACSSGDSFNGLVFDYAKKANEKVGASGRVGSVQIGAEVERDNSCWA